jgi:hypothetical protein
LIACNLDENRMNADIRNSDNARRLGESAFDCRLRVETGRGLIAPRPGGRSRRLADFDAASLLAKDGARSNGPDGGKRKPAQPML